MNKLYGIGFSNDTWIDVKNKICEKGDIILVFETAKDFTFTNSSKVPFKHFNEMPKESFKAVMYDFNKIKSFRNMNILKLLNV